MASVKKQIQKGVNLLKHGKYRTRESIASSERAKVAEDAEAAKHAQFANAQMPDSDALRRREKRKAARRPGSRVDTILTDQLGPEG